MREISEGFEIVATVIAEGVEWHAAEVAMIAKYREDGHDLLNLTDGGEGTAGHRFVGRKRPDVAEKNRLMAGKPGHAITEDSKAKISRANKGKKKPWLAERNRQAAGKPGHPHTEESRAAISRRHKGRVLTPEWRLKISLAHKRNAEMKRGASNVV